MQSRLASMRAQPNPGSKGDLRMVVFTLVLLLVASLTGTPASGSAMPKAAPAATPDTVEIKTKRTGNGIDISLPAITLKDRAIADKINADIMKASKSWECEKSTGERDATPREEYLKASTKLLGLSDRVLSFVVNLDSDCGGAYPDTSTVIFNYDLTTGKRIPARQIFSGRLRVAQLAKLIRSSNSPRQNSESDCDQLWDLLNESEESQSEPVSTRKDLAFGFSSGLVHVFGISPNHASRACESTYTIPLKALHKWLVMKP